MLTCIDPLTKKQQKIHSIDKGINSDVSHQGKNFLLYVCPGLQLIGEVQQTRYTISTVPFIVPLEFKNRIYDHN